MIDRKLVTIVAVAGLEGLLFHIGQRFDWRFLMVATVLIAAVQELLRREPSKPDLNGLVLASPILNDTGDEMTTLLIEITRANEGTERSIVETVLERHQSEYTRAIVVGYDFQRANLGAVLSAVEFRSFGNWQPEGEIVRRLAGEIGAVLASGQGSQPMLFSFHHSVLNKQGELAALGHQFDTRALKGYAFAARSAQWPEDLIPADDAVEMLVQVLTQAGATANKPLLKTDIRQLLQRRDDRFHKSAHPEAAKPGFISILLDRARATGRVEFAGAEPNVAVWLAGTGPSVAGQPATPVPSLQTATTATITVDVQPSDHELSYDQAKDERDKIYGEFVAALRQRNFGPYAAVRHAFFDAILQRSKETEGRKQLAGKMVSNAVEHVKASDLTEEVMKRYKDGTWDELADFGLKLLAQAGFLKSDGEAVSSEIPFLLPHSTVKTPLPDDLLFWLEVEMVMEVIRCAKVTWQSRKLLAGALYGHHGHNGQTSEYVERLEQIFDFLLKKRRVHYDHGSGELRVGAPAGNISVDGNAN